MNHEHDKSDGSVRSDRSFPFRGTLRPHGGYRHLRSFHVAEAVYDGTVAFCGRFVDKRSRTNDQMIQAARSGRQNIAEGSRASGTSSQIELRLVGVARASLDELLLDYEDFLRQRGLPIWDKDHPQALRVRRLGKQADRTDRSDPSVSPYTPYRTPVEQGSPEVAANTLVCLIHQANYLLDRQIQSLERDFIEGDGYSEQLAAERLRYRRETKDQADQSDPTDRADLRQRAKAPVCPACGAPMALRTARQGARAGSQFWGCTCYPDCRAVLPV